MASPEILESPAHKSIQSKLTRLALDSDEPSLSEKSPIDALNCCIQCHPWCRFGLSAVVLMLRMTIWALLLLPVLLYFAVRYFRDDRIHRRICYGPSKREFLDVYVPSKSAGSAKMPVVIGIMGGGFVIGHRGYNVQLGLRCAECGVIFVCVDYRNFPLSNVPGMVENVGRGVRWVFQNIGDYGGDTSNIMLTGQSAGAHLSAMLLLNHSLLEARHAKGGTGSEGMNDSNHIENSNSGEFDSWSVKDLKKYVGVSGPYDLERYAPYLGLPSGVVNELSMGNPHDCSPAPLLLTSSWREVAAEAASRLPPIHLFHGECDMLVPSWSSVMFAEQLREVGIPATLDVRAGVNHTYPVIEGPMAFHDIQLEQILPTLFPGDKWKRVSERLPRRRRPMWPYCIMKLANLIGPFGLVDYESARCEPSPTES